MKQNLASAIAVIYTTCYDDGGHLLRQMNHGGDYLRRPLRRAMKAVILMLLRGRMNVSRGFWAV
jgi:hypothetical protein